METWYALCYYKGKGKNKTPYQIRASRNKDKLLEIMERAKERNPDTEFKVKQTREFDKIRKGMM